MHTLDETRRKELADRLNQPLTIGGKTVSTRLWLAPLAGLGNAAYRQVLDGLRRLRPDLHRDVRGQERAHRKPARLVRVPLVRGGAAASGLPGGGRHPGGYDPSRPAGAGVRLLRLRHQHGVLGLRHRQEERRGRTAARPGRGPARGRSRAPDPHHPPCSSSSAPAGPRTSNPPPSSRNSSRTRARTAWSSTPAWPRTNAPAPRSGTTSRPSWTPSPSRSSATAT